MRLPEEFPHLLAPFLISLPPTDPESRCPSPLIVLHDNWLLLQLMGFITRRRETETDGRHRNGSGGDGEGMWVACVGLRLKIEPRSFSVVSLQMLCREAA